MKIIYVKQYPYPLNYRDLGKKSRVLRKTLLRTGFRRSFSGQQMGRTVGQTRQNPHRQHNRPWKGDTRFPSLDPPDDSLRRCFGGHQKRHRKGITLRHRRFHKSRTNDMNANPLFSQRAHQPFSVNPHRRLRGRIGRRPRKAAKPGQRTHQGDMPPPACDH